MSSKLPFARDLRNAEVQQKNFNVRMLAMGGLVLVCFALLVWRWSVLQIVRYDNYTAQAESNRTALVPITPNRGQILDRNGIVLATNYSAYTLELTPSKVENIDGTIEQLSAIISITPADVRRFKRLMQESRKYEPVPLRFRLNDEEVARFAVERYRFPGVEVNARLFRYYPYGEVGSHLIGYIGRINQKEKERIEEGDNADDYRGTTHIGKLGVELGYETVLHGQAGSEQMETTAGGFVVRRLASRPATPGKNVVLSIDIKLQKMVEDLYGNRRGALVAIDPRNGDILALVSKPTFDPNLFVDGIDSDTWRTLNESINKPLLNRALRGTYPPGSTYKPFMALAALETGTRTAGTVIQDPGYWMFGNHRFRSGHALGPVDLRRSIIHSSNVYYYTLGNEMGVQAIHDFMKPLGFGQITGIDLPGEVRGILPSPEWKANTFKRPEKQRWLPGETISLGIGQGYNSFTMVQLAHALGTLVNGGTAIQPRVVQSLQNPADKTTVEPERPPSVNLGYRPAHVQAVLQGMVGVTQMGTSRGVFAGAPYLSGGKTGTAQAITIGQNQRYNAAALSEYKRDHSLYVAFAPAENPTIAVALIVENAGFGAAAAAPIARRVLDYWLADRYPTPGDISATQVGRSSGLASFINAKTMAWPPAGTTLYVPVVNADTTAAQADGNKPPSAVAAVKASGNNTATPSQTKSGYTLPTNIVSMLGKFGMQATLPASAASAAATPAPTTSATTP